MVQAGAPNVVFCRCRAISREREVESLDFHALGDGVGRPPCLKDLAGIDPASRMIDTRRCGWTFTLHQGDQPELWKRVR